MGHIFLDQVLDSWNYLFGIVPADFSVKSALLRDKLKELTSFSQLESYHRSFLLGLTLQFDLGFEVVLYHIDEMAVLEVFEVVDLGLEGSLFGGAGEVDLECIELILFAG